MSSGTLIAQSAHPKVKTETRATLEMSLKMKELCQPISHALN